MSLCSDLDIDRLCIRFHAAIPYQQTLPLRFLCATGLWVARHALRICFPWKCTLTASPDGANARFVCAYLHAFAMAAGGRHTVLLRSDGCAVATGINMDGQCDIPPFRNGLNYTQVSAGSHHTVLLRSDGCAASCGSNDYGQCDIPVNC
eukprot:s17_g19.t2